MSLKEIFNCIQECSFFELFDETKFKEFSNNFTINHINSLQLKYPDIFEIKSLTSELKYIYLDSEFRKSKSPNAVLQTFHELGLLSALSESTKLIKLLTIPISSTFTERSFSTLDQVKSYLRSNMAQERLLSLGRISIK